MSRNRMPGKCQGRVSVVLLLLCHLACADNLEKETPYQKDRKEQQAKIASARPNLSAEETFRQYFGAMQHGDFAKASQFVHEDALKSLKAKTLNALRVASRQRCSEFLRRAGIQSIPALQHTPPHAFFEAVMKDGELVKTYLAHLRDERIESVKANETGDATELRAQFKTAPEETISLLLVTGVRSRQWKMVLIPPFDEPR